MADEDWFSANAPPQQPEKNWFAQNAPQTAAEVAEPQQQGGVISGIVAGLGRALNPINLVKGALDIGHESDISNIMRYGKTLGEIVTGKSPDEAIGKNIPELQQQREAVYGKLGGREQAAALTGIGLQLGLTALPFLHGETLPAGQLSKVAEPLIGKAPEAVPEAPLAAEARAATESVPVAPEVAQPVEPDLTAVNRELAPTTEPPSATAEPFPSLSQSAEDIRRTELQQKPPAVREAISLDEIRLMRERDELNAQNEIAKSATGATHPAVDERLGQIDEQLTNIANQELQPVGIETPPTAQPPQEGEINATQEGQVTESNQPEYTGNGQGGTPAETGGSGSTVNGEKVQTTTTPEVTSTQEPAAAPPAEPPKTGISNQRLTEAYGDAAPVATTGKGPGAWKDEGLSRLDNFQKTGDVNDDPYSVLTNLRTKGVPPEQLPSDVSLLRAEHQRLLEDARKAEGTPEYADKAKAALDMATAIKGVAHGPASDVFRALQEYDKPRYDNVTDFDQALREREGRESTPEEKTRFKKISEDVASTRNGAEKEINGVQKRISKFPRMSFDDAAKSIHDQITELTKDCVL